MRKDEKEPKVKKRPRARTIQSQEDEMISLAMRRAEEKLLDGTASNTLIIHFLKMGSVKEQLEKEMLKEQIELTKAKTEAAKSAKVQEELYREAMEAFKSYNGGADNEEEYEELY